MPRTLHDEVDLENATELVDALAGHKLSKDQEDYLETLTELIEAYESEHHPIKKIRGLDALKYLLLENGLNGAGLAQIIETSPSLAYKILAGTRNLTTAQIKLLAKRFCVDASLFI